MSYFVEDSSIRYILFKNKVNKIAIVNSELYPRLPTCSGDMNPKFSVESETESIIMLTLKTGD